MALVTLNEFVMERQSDFPYASGDLTRLLTDIGIAGKIINHKVNKAGLQDILGAAANINVQGETQMKMDVFSDETLLNAMRWGGQVAGAGSEENEKYFAFDLAHCKNAKYVILFDPLDGSSNIDVNVSIGTIFSIFRRKSSIGDLANVNDFLQKGDEQVAAGYIIYGSSTMLVYTTGHGVNGFTLQPSIGEFFLSHPNMKIPEDGTVFSMNEGNLNSCEKGVQEYIAWCKENDKKTNRPYSARYIGSLVADFHRNLIKGGIYIYPGTTKNKSGKLRMQYECNPLAFIVEQAGGKATDGHRRIMEIVPTDLHQRSPLFIGSKNMVDKVEALIKQHS
ncbi:MAG: class 1 fructose-bisphosphatase [Flavobacteriales bacterium]|jgi:fructose-1,6-bisphosphatase I|nr:class 1 fructose-bisphosphatase [Flavobacteriales bacterium]MDP4717141.1 class 1 fructose-bisphosphatase [Flavobacteriales bacterium]MDP4731076.1 class 1 fructose-bisphosphatase [Flavobacteriales bacterium]MDP4818604.1 class 1 fructose-bisphosphatase [Flavobacteriales bacterium]MDP4950914.1 class 1 fructose-bisphosphatase [Flavobacteriales bacterium]